MLDLNNVIKRLEKVNKKLADYELEKKHLTETIISHLDHDHDGQKSYEHGKYKLEVKTPVNYSLDKNAYEKGDVYIPQGFDPVQAVVSYRVNKKQANEWLNNGPPNVRDALSKLIEAKPGKPSVTVKYIGE